LAWWTLGPDPGGPTDLVDLVTWEAASPCVVWSGHLWVLGTPGLFQVLIFEVGCGGSLKASSCFCPAQNCLRGGLALLRQTVEQLGWGKARVQQRLWGHPVSLRACSKIQGPQYGNKLRAATSLPGRPRTKGVPHPMLHRHCPFGSPRTIWRPQNLMPQPALGPPPSL
jgi:hypothetical protein